MALKDDVERWQKSKGTGIQLGEHESDCLTNPRFVDNVLLFSISLVRLQKMLSNQSTNKRKEAEISNIIVEIQLAWRSAILSKEVHSSSKKKQRSKTESERPGYPSASTNKR